MRRCSWPESRILDGALVQQLGYDGNGNRTSFTGASATDTASATYDAQDRLLRYRNTEFGWTAAGELAWRFTADAPSGEEAGPQPFYGDTTHFEYDPLGNLLAVWSAGHDSVSYLVDGQNRRVGRKVNGTLVQGWLYQNGLNPIAELDGSGNVVARYVYGTRGHVPDYVVKGDTAYRIVTDHLGSVRLVVNASTGAIVERRDYDAWGVVLLDTSPGWLTLGYAGGIYDAATGLVRFGARDYDASVGRWRCKEPLQFAGGSACLYEYAAGDPINFQDPTGSAFVRNTTGEPVEVKGGTGPGLGHSGKDAFGVVPPDARVYGGKLRPVRGFADRQKARTNSATDHCSFKRPEDLIYDIDYYVDEAGRLKQIHGDDLGPTYELYVDKNGKVRDRPEGAFWWVDLMRSAARK